MAEKWNLTASLDATPYLPHPSHLPPAVLAHLRLLENQFGAEGALALFADGCDGRNGRGEAHAFRGGALGGFGGGGAFGGLLLLGGGEVDLGHGSQACVVRGALRSGALDEQPDRQDGDDHHDNETDDAGDVQTTILMTDIVR